MVTGTEASGLFWSRFYLLQTMSYLWALSTSDIFSLPWSSKKREGLNLSGSGNILGSWRTANRMNMRIITTNGDYYRKIFQLFCTKCHKTEVDIKWAQQVFPRLVIDKLNPQHHPDKSETFRSLGIGSGTGSFECSLLRQLSMRYTNIHHTVVEPAKSFIEQYQCLLASDEYLKGIHFDWKVQTMQTFQEESERATEGDSPNKFQFVSSVHSLYYADDMKDSIRFFHSVLEVGGILMIAVTTDQSSNTKLWTHFPLIMGHNPHINLVNSAGVERSLKTLDLPYDVHTQSSAADITSVFDETSTEGNFLLDFMTHTIDFRSAAPAHLRDDVISYLHSRECCQIEDNGTVLFVNPWKTFVIQKM